jgi:putative flavoprotein involved in K+ transport
MTNTVVIGAGVAGLAVTRCLRDNGVEAIALDENAEVGHSWANRYDNLKLNSVRWLSHMPGLPMPKSYGRWVSRDDLVEYVTTYAAPIRDHVRTGVKVLRVERGGRWRVVTDQGDFDAAHVVVATGLYGKPVIPAWPGRETYRGQLLHAADYMRTEPFEGKRVLVVGPGVSGVDIAADLLSRRTGELVVAVRTPPNFLPRELYNIPLQGLSVTNRHAPTAVQDLGGKLIQWLSVGDLGDTPLGRPTEGMFSRLKRTGVNPAVDDGVFVPAVRAGRVEVVDEVVGLSERGVVTGSGKEVEADVIIAATGYRTGLHDVLGPIGVLDDRGVPPQYGKENEHWADQGLHFVGFASPLTGHLREIGLIARKTAKRITRAPVASPVVSTS